MYCIEISLDNIVDNARFIKETVSAPLIAVVKANAYGHGMTEVAESLMNAVSAFAVATVEEALELSRVVPESSIIVLSVANTREILPSNIIPSVSSEKEITGLRNLCKGVCLAVNSGMNRFGCAPEDVERLSRIAECNGIVVNSVYSHLHNAESITDCKRQLDLFCKSTKRIQKRIPRHLCASNCLRLKNEFRLDAVRAGISLYGFGHESLKSALKVFGFVLCVRRVKIGESIGYGEFMAERDMTVCIASFGYADCIRRKVDGLYATVNGIRCRAVGVACMDVTFFDVSGVDCNVGDRVYLIEKKADVEELARLYETVPYEILTSLNGRAKRIYERKQS